MPSVESAEVLRGDKDASGPWINLDNIVPRSDSSNNDDGFPTVEELLSSGGKDAARPSGSQDKPIMIEDDAEDDDSEGTELDESVCAARDMPCTPPTTVASSSAKTSLPSARKRVTKDDSDDEAYSFWALNTRQDEGEHVAQLQHGGHCLNTKSERDGDHNSIADVTDAIGSDIDEMDHADVDLRLRGIAENDRDVASASSSAKRKLPLFTTDGSGDSNSAPPQHHSKRRRRYYRRHRFSAPVPSDGELDTSDETSGSSFVPCRTRRGQGQSEPSRVPQWCRLTKPHGRRPDAEPTGRRGSLQRLSPCSSGIASPAANKAVVFEQQRWEGEIIEERLVRQERGRPRKQFLIKWKPSWVDSGRLAAPELITNWEESGREGVRLIADNYTLIGDR